MAGLQVGVDLARVVGNCRDVMAATRVFTYAVVKADAYGCGARAVSRALAGAFGKDVLGFYCFDLAEAVAADLKSLGRNTIALDQPWLGYTGADYLSAGVRPIVHSIERAAELKACDPVLSVDTGMRRFGIAPGQVKAALAASGGKIREAMSHAVRPEHITLLKEATAGHDLILHGAATALLGDASSYLHATRPGLALYRGAMSVSSVVVEARDTGGEAGYTRFKADRVGVFLGGYNTNLKTGTPCVVNGRRTSIRELGMQSGFTDLLPGEGPGTVVRFLGDGLTEADLAAAWGCSGQEVLVRLGKNRGPE